MRLNQPNFASCFSSIISSATGTSNTHPSSANLVPTIGFFRSIKKHNQPRSSCCNLQLTHRGQLVKPKAQVSVPGQAATLRRKPSQTCSPTAQVASHSTPATGRSHEDVSHNSRGRARRESRETLPKLYRYCLKEVLRNAVIHSRDRYR